MTLSSMLLLVALVGTPHDFLEREFSDSLRGFTAKARIARPALDRPFTLSGTVEGEGLTYEITGTVYATGNVRGYFRRRTDAGLFQEPVNGNLDESGHRLSLDGLLFVPSEGDRKPFQFLMSRDQKALIRVVRQKSIAGLEEFGSSIDLEKGVYKEITTGGASTVATFSPIPKVVEFGDSEIYWLSKEQVAIGSMNRLSITFRQTDDREPRVALFCDPGNRRQQAIRWTPTQGSTPSVYIIGYPNGKDPVRINMEYEVAEMTRADLDKLLGRPSRSTRQDSGTSPGVGSGSSSGSSAGQGTGSTTLDPKPREVRGTVRIIRPGRTTSADMTDQTAIEVGMTLVAPGPKEAKIILEHGVAIELQPGTKIVREKNGYRLLEGKFQFSRSEPASPDFLFMCLSFAMTPVGTTFEAERAAGSRVLRLSCSDGMVRIRRTDDDSEAIEVEAGQSITLIGSN